MRLRRRPRGVPGEASPDPELAAGRLYFITPDVDPPRLAALALAAVRGGADIVQLRHKHLARGELLAAARALRAITVDANRLFVVNDHVDIALLSGADAVHVGPDDITVEGARSAAGDRLLIGASASTVQQLTRLGLHRVCVIRAIGDARDPEAAARRLRAMLEA